jgi:hypothetical protein
MSGAVEKVAEMLRQAHCQECGAPFDSGDPNEVAKDLAGRLEDAIARGEQPESHSVPTQIVWFCARCRAARKN